MYPALYSLPDTRLDEFVDRLRRVLAIQSFLEERVDTEAIAAEIVYLKNKVQELESAGRGESPAAHALRDRMRALQNRLADDTKLSETKEPDSQADKVRFIPPS